MRIWFFLSAIFLIACTNTESHTENYVEAQNKVDNSLATLAQQYPRGAPILPAQVKHNFIKGADVSSLSVLEEAHRDFYYFDGSKLDALTLLKMQGFNTIALKLYHNQANDDKSNNNLANILALATRIKELGMNFNLQIQYADSYTIPSIEEQAKSTSNPMPKAWQNMQLDELNLALFAYSRDVIKALAQQNTLPNMVQIGTSLDQGFLQHHSAQSANYANFASLLKHAIAGVEEGYRLSGEQDFKIILNFNAHKTALNTLSSLLEREVRCDLVSLNYNVLNDGAISDVVALVNKIKAFNKEVVVNSSYAYTLDNFDEQNNLINAQNAHNLPYPISIKGQENYLRDVMEAISNTDNGIGFFYIEPAFLAYDVKPNLDVKHQNHSIPKKSSQSAQENQALFDNNGRLLDSIKVFNDFM